jgi:hypothetical protein
VRLEAFGRRSPQPLMRSWARRAKIVSSTARWVADVLPLQGGMSCPMQCRCQARPLACAGVSTTSA